MLDQQLAGGKELTVEKDTQTVEGAASVLALSALRMARAGLTLGVTVFDQLLEDRPVFVI